MAGQIRPLGGQIWPVTRRIALSQNILEFRVPVLAKFFPMASRYSSPQKGDQRACSRSSGDLGGLDQSRVGGDGGVHLGEDLGE